MNFCSKKEIKNILNKYNISPIKKLGQNFLIDRRVLDKLINSAEIKKEDVILEIGSGIGTLTTELAQKAKKIIAVEKDRRLIKILKNNLSSFKNIEVINKDIRDIKIKEKNYKIVSNLPFYITGVITKDFLEQKNRPSLMSIIMQKELIQRICASPPNMNLPAISVQFYATPQKIDFISKNSFWPPPKVDAGIIKIKLKNLSSAYGSFVDKKEFQEKFFEVIRAGFRHKRKKLVNNLSTELSIKKSKIEEIFSKIGLNKKQRAETLRVKEWISLSKQLMSLY